MGLAPAVSPNVVAPVTQQHRLHLLTHSQAGRTCILPRALMSYLGLVPSEFSSGNTRRQGAITRCGNKHARRILVEAAWNNRFKAQVTRALHVRQEGQPKVIREISWKAQLRLSKRWRSLSVGRKLNQNKICVAIARELAGFIWDVARHVKISA